LIDKIEARMLKSAIKNATSKPEGSKSFLEQLLHRYINYEILVSEQRILQQWDSIMAAATSENPKIDPKQELAEFLAQLSDPQHATDPDYV
jgi:hypothetical protein